MIYKDLNGNQAEGELWSDGPAASTVWVIPADGSDPVVVSTRKPCKQIEYSAPERPLVVAKEIEDAADEVLARYHEVGTLFAELGVTPIGDDHKVAVAVKKIADAARKARQPYINGHGGKRAVGDEKLKELRGEHSID